MLYSDKTMGMTIGRNAEDVLDMYAILFGPTTQKHMLS